MSSRRKVQLCIALTALTCGLVVLNACDGNGSPRSTLEGVSDCSDPLSESYPCDDTPTDDDGGSGDDDGGPGDDDGGTGGDDGGSGDDDGSGDDEDGAGDDETDEDRG